MPSDCTKHAVALLISTLLSAGRPGISSAGVNVWTSSGPAGGNITAIAIDPTHPATVYAATGRFPGGSFVGGGGGVFKSVAAGVSWTSVTRGLRSPLVNALAIDPRTPTIIYAGTNDGVAKSTNGGLSWDSAGLTSMRLNALVVAPTASTTLYAGANGVVFTSVDGGANWTAHVLPLTSEVLCLAVDPTTPSIVYAGTKGDPLGRGSVFRSTDGGVHWRNIGLDLFVYALAIDPTNPSIIYASGIAGVYKSTDRGDAWSYQADFAGNALAVDPTAPSTLYLGTTAYGILKSTDGGTNWQFVNTGFQLDVGAPAVFALAIDPTTPTTIYAGMEAYLCNGLFKGFAQEVDPAQKVGRLHIKPRLRYLRRFRGFRRLRRLRTRVRASRIGDVDMDPGANAFSPARNLRRGRVRSIASASSIGDRATVDTNSPKVISSISASAFSCCWICSNCRRTVLGTLSMPTARIPKTPRLIYSRSFQNFSRSLRSRLRVSRFSRSHSILKSPVCVMG